MEGLEFEVHTHERVYTLRASYFIASSDGVMFFDTQDRGIAFVPSEALDLVRVSSTKEERKEALRQQLESMPLSKDIFFK